MALALLAGVKENSTEFLAQYQGDDWGMVSSEDKK